MLLLSIWMAMGAVGDVATLAYLRSVKREYEYGPLRFALVYLLSPILLPLGLLNVAIAALRPR